MSHRCLLLVVTLNLACTMGLSWAETSETSSEDQDLDQVQTRSQQQDMVEALQVLLGQMHNADKRGTIAMCRMGDRCAMKFGPRIGKLCDCGRGANCNSFLLKCI